MLRLFVRDSSLSDGFRRPAMVLGFLCAKHTLLSDVRQYSLNSPTVSPTVSIGIKRALHLPLSIP
jgi:hypothetical protein